MINFKYEKDKHYIYETKCLGRHGYTIFKVLDEMNGDRKWPDGFDVACVQVIDHDSQGLYSGFETGTIFNLNTAMGYYLYSKPLVESIIKKDVDEWLK